MNFAKSVAVACAVTMLFAVLTGCGGSVGTTVATPNPNYQFIAPKVNSQSVFSDVIVDNLNNTFTRTLEEKITAVNADGSFTGSWNDPSKTVTTSGTVDQTFYPTVSSYNNLGQTLGYTVTPYSGSSTTCTASPHLGEVPSPLTGSQSWTLNFSLACGSGAATSVSQIGEFMDAELLSVPAGNFNSYRFVSTLVSTQGGVTTTQYVTTWLNDSATDSRVLQVVTDYVYGGSTAAPQGSIVSDTMALQSYQ